MKRLIRMFAILLLVLVAAGGCYTQLRQPAVEPYSGYSAQEHDDWDSWYSPPGFSLYDPWTLPYYTTMHGPVPYAWVPYYYYPWYWWDPGTPNTPWPPVPVERGGRHAWDRGPGAPQSGNISPPPGIPGSVQPGRASGGTTGSGNGGNVPPDTSGTPDRSGRRDGERPKRNAWGR